MLGLFLVANSRRPVWLIQLGCVNPSTAACVESQVGLRDEEP